MLRAITILLMFLGVAFAQDNLSNLRYEALRLTLESKISELPADLQSEARDLLSRAEALGEPLVALREKVLTAYITELQRGKEPYLALATARNTVADERLELLPDVRTLLLDIRAFMNDHPEVAPVFRELRESFQENRLN
jgi:hypothetical protein